MKNQKKTSVILRNMKKNDLFVNEYWKLIFIKNVMFTEFQIICVIRNIWSFYFILSMVF